MYSHTEKREYVRIELENKNYREIETPCIARFHTKQDSDNENSNPEWDIVSVKNLSAGGMVFIFDKSLGIDSMLNIRFKISQSQPTINCVGRIVRIEERQHLSGYCTAIAFTEVSAQTKSEINRTIEEIVRKKKRKKNFSIKKLVRVVSFMKRREVVSEQIPETPSSLLKRDITDMRACCSCNKSLSAKDISTGFARKHYGQLYCLECSSNIRNKRDCGNTIKSEEAENSISGVVKRGDAVTNSDTSAVVMREEHTETVKNRIDEKLENLVEEVYDQTEVFRQNEKLRRVTFRLPKFAAPMANRVNIVGDFNNWDSHCNPMIKERNGDHTLSLDLEPGNNYKFGYLVDSVLIGLSNCSIKIMDNVEENPAICL
ncbi:MAG: hypothetical protein D8M57_03120 [Candidatus Scalindua sp. AMX11]|nr:MAG: hypothetical protein DWQ00_16870 [Candidatus Scalindua sp.]NOG85857.1 hypothetical protein [Planctomycetota bacterium]RZV96971.1 MAG: hypothetical protein EX341_01950 [Candidatus Scalindua sp. SCAELEC01]TDE66417.1 MAG: hypothetical protein D8M57_03120 [Candidatus Scalindua sp. AMX11]GJQ58192.1 MAG: hypothetical protein SCALA701_09930 [Candidatus Scalindua sp.]